MKVTPVEVVKAFEISFYLDNQDVTGVGPAFPTKPPLRHFMDY